MTSALPPRVSALLTGFEERKPAALARALSLVENRGDGADLLLAALHPRVGKAWRIGLTGPPGAGKSTLTMQLARHYRMSGLTVGVVAVDPTSPFTGGALLGDRVRMETVALDPGVFIRSMATRGSLGGLAGATRDVCDVFDAFGFDRILIETVGVGQSELDVSRTADSSVVILVPESGDSIQTLKAGLMEIADVFVVNKADRPDADRLVHELGVMLGMRAGAGVWVPPVLKTVGRDGDGTAELATAIDRHRVYLESSGKLQERRRRRLRERVRDEVEHRLRRHLWNDADTAQWLEARIPDLEAGTTSPLAVADGLLARSASLLSGID